MQSATQPSKDQPDRTTQDCSWQGQDCWRLLVTDFGDGLPFLQVWQRWRQDAHAPRLLHYVAFSQQVPHAAHLQQAAHTDPLLAPLVEILTQNWFGFLDGFHRFVLDQGRVHLTLCVGDSMALMRQQAFKADAIELCHLPVDAEALNTLKGIRRCCRRGTALTLQTRGIALSEVWLNALHATGFGSINGQMGSVKAVITAYEPEWLLSRDDEQAQSARTPPTRCAVLGAGLAGASVAAALARRGWQVTVLEREPKPASGASGLPVGLLVAHVSSDDCTLSQLSRAGVRLTFNEAQCLLQPGQDWAHTGVLEHRFDARATTPANWSTQGAAWCEPVLTGASTQANDPGNHTLLHRPAGWLKPAALVNAWLAQDGIALKTNTAVHAVRCGEFSWQLLDASGDILCEAEHVVLANALDAAGLLQRLAKEDDSIKLPVSLVPQTRGLRGLLSWATHTADDLTDWPSQAMNGKGSATGHVPTRSGAAWFVGASYQEATQPERSDRDNHLRNLDKLRVLNPALADTMLRALEAGRLQSWKGMRCATDDHLPLVGPVAGSAQAGLWLCVGMGSRGMSLSMLCAELLASHIGAEPLPIPVKLAKSLSATRNKASVVQTKAAGVDP